MAGVGIGVVFVGLFLLKLTQAGLGVGVLQVFLILCVVRAGQCGDFIVALVGLLVSTVAVNGLQVIVAVVVTIVLSVDVHAVVVGIHGLTLVLGQLVVGSDSGVVQGVGVASLINSHLHKVVGPSHALAVALGAQGLSGVKNVVDPTAVLVVILIDCVNVEIVQLNSGYLMFADDQGSGHAGSKAGDGGLEGHTGYQRYAQGQNYPEGGGVDFQLLSFFCGCLLLLGHAGSVLLLAELLLAGCTHGNQFLSFICYLVGCVKQLDA